MDVSGLLANAKETIDHAYDISCDAMQNENGQGFMFFRDSFLEIFSGFMSEIKKDEKAMPKSLSAKINLAQISADCIAMLYGEIFDQIDQLKGNVDEAKTPTRSHFVYIGKRIGCEEYKIGITSNISQRESTIKTGCPKFSIVAHLECKNRTLARTIERGLHSELAQCCIGGEWFDLARHVVDKIIMELGFTIPLTREENFEHTERTDNQAS